MCHPARGRPAETHAYLSGRTILTCFGNLGVRVLCQISRRAGCVCTGRCAPTHEPILWRRYVLSVFSPRVSFAKYRLFSPPLTLLTSLSYRYADVNKFCVLFVRSKPPRIVRLATQFCFEFTGSLAFNMCFLDSEAKHEPSVTFKRGTTAVWSPGFRYRGPPAPIFATLLQLPVIRAAGISP